MILKLTGLRICIVMLIVLVTFSCILPGSTSGDSAGTGSPTNPPGQQVENTQSPAQGVTTQPPTAAARLNCALAPPSDYTGPAPKPGLGNLYGHLLWNSKPLVGTQAKLCKDANYKNECPDPGFPATSDENGMIVITDVPPGEYDFLVKDIQQERWLETNDVTENYKTIKIEADQCLSAGNVNIPKFDLFQKAPTNNATVNSPKPTLTWDAYPEMGYYEINLLPEHGKALYFQLRVESNEFTPDADLPTCKYAWKVKAFNTQGIKIAETEDFFNFAITGSALSCNIANPKPASNSTISGEGVILSWDPHPLAAKYQISMVKDDPYTKILDYVEVTEPTYTIPTTLQPGDYYWDIYAKDQFGDDVAGSGNVYLTVK